MTVEMAKWHLKYICEITRQHSVLTTGRSRPINKIYDSGALNSFSITDKPLELVPMGKCVLLTDLPAHLAQLTVNVNIQDLTGFKENRLDFRKHTHQIQWSPAVHLKTEGEDMEYQAPEEDHCVILTWHGQDCWTPDITDLEGICVSKEQLSKGRKAGRSNIFYPSTNREREVEGIILFDIVRGSLQALDDHNYITPKSSLLQDEQSQFHAFTFWGPYWDQCYLISSLNDIDEGIECDLSKFAVDMPEGWDTIQRDLDKLQK
ncbi:hypothetical protein BTVI_75696 [Pitangus sulphuratus]|nr:hypothetical protein BTVI_75696 [Pitangus sulphuratus]